jgi:hypothetical protein
VPTLVDLNRGTLVDSTVELVLISGTVRGLVTNGLVLNALPVSTLELIRGTCCRVFRAARLVRIVSAEKKDPLSSFFWIFLNRSTVAYAIYKPSLNLT